MMHLLSTVALDNRVKHLADLKLLLETPNLGDWGRDALIDTLSFLLPDMPQIRVIPTSES